MSAADTATPPRPRPMALHPLSRLGLKGHISADEWRAGREIGSVCFLTSLPARGRLVTTYGERVCATAPRSLDGALDMEARFREWHGWAKEQPAVSRQGSPSLAALTIVICADEWTVNATAERFRCGYDTALRRLRESLAAYCLFAGWPAAALDASRAGRRVGA